MAETSGRSRTNVARIGLLLANFEDAADGRLIVFYNHATPIKAGAFFPRTPLCYAVSADGGKTWSAPVIVDDEGAANKDRQNIYPAACFTKEGMVVMWSSHQADPKGSFAGQYNPNIGGGKRAILAMRRTLLVWGWDGIPTYRQRRNKLQPSRPTSAFTAAPRVAWSRRCRRRGWGRGSFSSNRAAISAA